MKVKFLPMQKEVEIKPEQTVLEVALANQVPIRTVCKGVPSCCECRVRIVEGENLVLPPNKAELSLIGSGYFVDHRRLSCQLHCFGDVTIDVSEQLAKSNDTSLRKMRGGGKKGTITESQAIQDTYLLKEKTNIDAINADLGSNSNNSSKSSSSGRTSNARDDGMAGADKDSGERYDQQESNALDTQNEEN